MGIARRIDMEILLPHALRYGRATRKQERGDILRAFMAATHLKSRATAIKKLKEAARGNFDDVARGKQKRVPRKSAEKRRIEKDHTKIIANIKITPGEKASYFVSTEAAIETAESAGMIPVGLYNRTKMDRLLREHGLNQKAWKATPAAHGITAKYPNHVWVMDATPMNQYYMRIDRKIVPYDAPPGDKHLDDLLAREHLVKVWCYGAIDMYSKVFILLPFAEEPQEGKRNRGENAETWLKAIEFFLLSKTNLPSLMTGYGRPLQDCPFEGKPDIIFCDKGSGIGNSTLVNKFARRLGIRVETHLPGNASAKGIIESNLGAFKRSVEVRLNRHMLDSEAQLQFFYQAHCASRNRKRGFYDKYRVGIAARGPKNPLIRISEENIRDAKDTELLRVINGYGCVSISNQEFFVTHHESYIGSKVSIFSRPGPDGEKIFVAEMPDGVIFKCDPAGRREHDFEDIKSFEDSEGTRNRAEVRKLTHGVQRAILYDDVLPEEHRRGKSSNVVHLPQAAGQIDTHSPIAPAKFTSKETARAWLLNQTGVTDDQLLPEIIKAIEAGFDVSIATMGHIDGNMIMEYSNIIVQSKQKIKERQFQ